MPPESLPVVAEGIATKFLWSAVAIAIVWLAAQALTHWLTMRRLRGLEVFYVKVIMMVGTASLVASPLTFGIAIRNDASAALGKTTTVSVDMGATHVVIALNMLIIVVAFFCAYRFRVSHMKTVAQNLALWSTLPEEKRNHFNDLFA
jgi:hypothetical protein